MKKSWLYGGVLIVALGAAAAWFVLSRTPDQEPDVSGEKSPSRLSELTRAKRLVYDVEWTASQSRRFGNENSLAGKIELKGRLELITLPNAGDTKVAAARLYDLERAQLALLGQPVDTATLEGARARITWSKDGVLESLATPKDTDPTIAHTLWGLFSRMQLTSPPRRQESTPLGTREVQYAREGNQNIRRGTSYISLDGIPNLAEVTQKLDALTRFERTTGDLLKTMAATEQLTVNDSQGTVLESASTLSLNLVKVGSASAIPITAGFVPRDMASAAKRADTKALAARAKGVSKENLLSTLRAFSGPKSVNAFPEWLWQASGRLQLEPGISKDIAAMVASGDLDLEGMRLATDLLAGVGHPEAQSAMREIFDYLREEENGDLVELVQRAGFLSLPESDTVASVKDLFSDETGDGLHHARAYTLGAKADALWSKG
jgi:hypothetical protein